MIFICPDELTEAYWKQWQSADIERCLEPAFRAFGRSRLMIGCILSGEYEPVMKVVIDYVSKLPAEAQAAVLGDNCARFYGIR